MPDPSLLQRFPRIRQPQLSNVFLVASTYESRCRCVEAKPDCPFRLALEVTPCCWLLDARGSVEGTLSLTKGMLCDCHRKIAGDKSCLGRLTSLPREDTQNSCLFIFVFVYVCVSVCLCARHRLAGVGGGQKRALEHQGPCEGWENKDKRMRKRRIENGKDEGGSRKNRRRENGGKGRKPAGGGSPCILSL